LTGRKADEARGTTMKEDVKLLMDLRELRHEAGVQASQVSAKSGIARSSYLEIENGRRPSLDTALKLARYLQIHVDEIWGLVEDSEELEKEKKNAGSRK